MSSFTEVFVIAVVLFLWESALWLPLRSVALRRRMFGKSWKVLHPGGLFATRFAGVIPMLPLPPDAGLAPCQGPPLLADAHGAILMESDNGFIYQLGDVPWSGFVDDSSHLVVAGTRIRLSSPRCIDVLRRAKNRGLTPQAATVRAWRMALSPSHAGREWRRWQLVSAPVKWQGLFLTLGFFAGLPAAYLFWGALSAGCFALGLWLIMGLTACHLWWLAKRVYPGARGALRIDSLLALLVPFHAMRALEIASVHAMGATHPIGLILSTGDTENPWLGTFIRKLLHSLPDSPESAAYSSSLLPLVTRALASHGKIPQDYDVAPDRAKDPAAVAYCPRCHAIYQAGPDTCPDCRGVELRKFY